MMESDIEETLKSNRIKMNKRNIRKKCYLTDRNKMGKCLIINNINFVDNQESKRKGAERDSDRLKIVFENLGFDVKVLTDLYSQVMLTEIEEHAKMEENKKSSAFVLIIMSHGKEGFVCGTEPNGLLNVKDIVAALNNENCPMLRDKPKLCFFQACNGLKRSKALEEEKEGTGEEEDSISPDQPKPKTYPIVSDTILSFAAQEGFKTCRCPNEGGRYINCLADALVEYAYTCEIREILEIVEEKLRKIRAEIKGDKICMSTEVKLLGWDRKFYFYPQEQADGSGRTHPDVEEVIGTEMRSQPGQALNMISGLCVIGGSGPPEYLFEERGVEVTWRALDGTGLEGFDYCQAIAYHKNSVYVATDRGLLVWMPKCNANIMFRKFESPRQGYAHAFLNGKIYVMGGQVDDEPDKEFWVYDTGNTIWEERDDLSSSCSGRSLVLRRDKLYITPGEEDELTDKLDTFDPEKRNWSTIPASMSVKRRGHATATCGAHIWVFGGCKGKGRKQNVCKDVERYDFKTRSWEEMSPMLTARSHLSVTYFKGKFYATGGIGERGKDLNVVEIYNPQNDKWTRGLPLVHARSMHNAIVITD